MDYFEEDYQMINGHKFLSVSVFAKKTKRSAHTIYQLIKHGNAIRKLRCKIVGTQKFIPIEEGTNFPFLPSGRQGHPYHFTSSGKEELCFVEDLMDPSDIDAILGDN